VIGSLETDLDPVEEFAPLLGGHTLRVRYRLTDPGVDFLFVVGEQ
jgi:hypothetical protein